MKKTISAVLFGCAGFYLTALKPCNSQHVVDKNKSPFEILKCDLHNFIWTYRVETYTALALIYIAFLLYWDYRNNSRTKKNISDFIDTYFDHRLSSDITAHRITVYKRARFTQAFLYFWKGTFLELRKYFKTDIFLRLKKCPIIGAEYLIIYTRFGYPNQNIKSTIFKIHDNIADGNSFVEYIYHRKTTESVTLPYIDKKTFDFYKKNHHLNPNTISPEIKKYMRLSHINNPSTLIGFSRLSPFIGGIPIFVKKKSMSRASHLVVYDSENQPFEKAKGSIERLAKYIEIVLKNK